jgi:NAD(P)-dependent dehydrogenase (short-subunit alcohol dehydrogenase family)
MFKDSSLAGLRVLITAGASGIGLVIAQGFIEAGARVFVCDIDKLSLEQAIKSQPGLMGCEADVADEASIQDMMTQAKLALGGLDVLINNAGIAGPTSLIDAIERHDLERTFAVNVTSQFLCVKYAIKQLRQSKQPSIVNMSSAAGQLGMPARSAYSASKWAVIGLTKSLAIELGKEGIRCNAVLPGAVDGPRIRAVIEAKAKIMGKSLDDVTSSYENQASLKRMITPEDVANTVLFVVSDAGRSINGQALAVDGHTQALS